MSIIVPASPRSVCLLCGSPGNILYAALRDRYYDAPGEWNLRRCVSETCGLVWSDPLVDPGHVGVLYARYYTHAESDKPADWLRSSHRRIVATIARARAQDSSKIQRGTARFVGFMHPAGLAELHHGVLHLPKVRPGQRLLDIGTGSAKHIRHLEHMGLIVEGIESDPEAAMAARRRGLNVTEGDFMTHHFQRQSFDFVTMSHVIEHLTDPVAAMRKIWDILVPGGQLVLQTPNVDSRGHRRWGRNWSMLDVPRHLTLFGYESMRRLVEGIGLSVEVLTGTVCYAREVYVISRRLQQQPAAKPSLVLGVRDSLAGVPYQIAERTMRAHNGEELLLIAQKRR